MPPADSSARTRATAPFTEYQYDAAGQLEHVVHYRSAGVINARFDYVYDATGRRIQMTTLDGVWNYTYDGIGQLTHAVFMSNDSTLVPNQDLEYVYDAVGNRIRTIINGVTTAYTSNHLNQYTQIGTATYAYDLDGNLSSRTDGGSTTTYSYDAAEPPDRRDLARRRLDVHSTMFSTTALPQITTARGRST